MCVCRAVGLGCVGQYGVYLWGSMNASQGPMCMCGRIPCVHPGQTMYRRMVKHRPCYYFQSDFKIISRYFLTIFFAGKVAQIIPLLISRPFSMVLI
jgi:hypothetical protein